MPAHNGRMVLAPRDTNLAPDPSRLIVVLQRAGFLGAALEAAGGRYAVGDDFLQLVAFTGCAVQLETNPQASMGRPFCHVHVAGPYPAPKLLVGRNTRPPRCPACRTPLRDWRTLPLLHADAAQPHCCLGCGATSPLCEWDWKDSGGCARVALEMEEVFPGEAAPTDALMQLLAQATHADWRHFYIQD